MKKHESGLDLLRCIAFLFVVLFHSYLNNGYTFQPQSGVIMFFAGAARWLSVSCIGIYLMLSGYLRCEKEINASYFTVLVRTLCSYFIISAVSIPYRHFILGDVQSFSVWMRRLFSFSACYYGWYVAMFIGLILISPLINAAVNSISSEKILIVICITVTAATSVSGTVREYPIFPSYWKAAYPLAYYLIGAVLKKLQPKPSKLICSAVALVIPLILSAISMGSTDGNFSTAVYWEFGDLPIVLLSVAVFLAVYRIELPSSIAKIAKLFSSGLFEAYLISHMLDAKLYTLFPGSTLRENYLHTFLCVTLPIYFISAAPGILINRITMIITKPVNKGLRKLDTKIADNKKAKDVL